MYLKCKQTYFVVFQLRLWSFAILTARAHQTRATLTFQLDNNGADIDTLCASHDNCAAYLIEVCEGYITGLVEHDRGLHRHAGRPWRCDRRVCAILVHVNGPCVMCFCFQSCDLDREHQASRGCCGWAALRQRFVVGGRRSWQWGETRWKSLGTKTKSTSTWASVTIHWISESESIFGINKRFRAKFSCQQQASCATVVVCNCVERNPQASAEHVHVVDNLTGTSRRMICWSLILGTSGCIEMLGFIL